MEPLDLDAVSVLHNEPSLPDNPAVAIGDRADFTAGYRDGLAGAPWPVDYPPPCYVAGRQLGRAARNG